jgi:hypothetical protein
MPHTLILSKVKSKKKVNVSEQNPWDAAIAEAKRKIAELKFSIRDFQKRKERGDDWLGMEKGQKGF